MSCLFLVHSLLPQLLVTVVNIFQIHETAELRPDDFSRTCSNNNQIDESTSYYSSSYEYSSFLKTDAGSGSNDDSNMPENKFSKTDYVSINLKFIIDTYLH